MQLEKDSMIFSETVMRNEFLGFSREDLGIHSYVEVEVYNEDDDESGEEISDYRTYSIKLLGGLFNSRTF